MHSFIRGSWDRFVSCFELLLMQISASVCGKSWCRRESKDGTAATESVARFSARHLQCWKLLEKVSETEWRLRHGVLNGFPGGVFLVVFMFPRNRLLGTVRYRTVLYCTVGNRGFRVLQ